MEVIPFGRTGHLSSRVLFGAAALGGMQQDRADRVLETVLASGINHIDVAASYGDAELRLAPFLADHRDEFFLASKTGDRDYDGAKASIERSLERMQIPQLDLIQFHNLARDADWETVFSNNGALRAALDAKADGLVRFIGVTGHGTRIAEMHLKSLDAYDFDSVLLPYNPMMMSDPRYADEFESLYRRCRESGVAMQTIKSIARRRWREDDPSPRYSWYEPIREQGALERAVNWVLRRPGLFLNSSSDATLLPRTVAAANQAELQGDDLEQAISQDADNFSYEPLFERGVQDDVR